MPATPKLHRLWFTSAGDVHLRVLVAGWCTIGDWWHERHVNQPFWRLYANDAPGAEIELADGGIVPLEPGRVWLLPAGLSFTSRTRRPACARGQAHPGRHRCPDRTILLRPARGCNVRPDQ